MYVKTQFEKIINLTNFDEIKFEGHKKQHSGTVVHRIYAVSEAKSSPIAVSGTSTKTSKSAILAEFPEDMAEEAKEAYNSLFIAIFAGNIAFDLTDYFLPTLRKAEPGENRSGSMPSL